MTKDIARSAASRTKEPVDVLIKRHIRAGKYVAGQRLIEVDLMRQFGVTQRQVRDALRKLETEGLVTIEKHRGAAVRRLSRKEFLCIVDVQDSLALLAIEKVVANLNARNRKIITESLKACVKFRKQSANEKKRARKFFEENVRFWNSLALVADNPVLWNIQDHLDNLLCLVGVHGILIDTDADRWITFHEEILQAILDRNLALAQGLVRKSAADINEAILELGDEAFV